MKQEFQRICVVDTVYTLFLYLLISTIDEIHKTFFFFSSGIPEEIRNNFKNNSYYFDNNVLNYKTYKRICIELRLFAKIIWPFLNNKKLTYWGHSHLFYSCGIIQNNKLNIIEDGIGNYTHFNVPKKIRFRWLKEKLFGSFYIREDVWGTNRNCSSVYLTGLMKIDESIKEKVKIIDVKKQWNLIDARKKDHIFYLFNIDENDINIFNRDSILLVTQCFSEDGSCKEETKIRMYRDIIEKYCSSTQLIIKPHPREKTEYSNIFPDAIVYNKRIPLELLLLLGARIQNVVTVNSTFSYSLSKDVNSIILGNEFFLKYKDL